MEEARDDRVQEACGALETSGIPALRLQQIPVEEQRDETCGTTWWIREHCPTEAILVGQGWRYPTGEKTLVERTGWRRA